MMALDVGVGDGSSMIPVQGEPSLILNADGYYCFLHSQIEQLAVETGQYIDLYGDASFCGESLAALERMLVEARARIQSQRESWEVHVGTRVETMQHRTSSKPIFKTVRRDQFLMLIDQWKNVIARAKELNRPVVCFGD